MGASAALGVSALSSISSASVQADAAKTQGEFSRRQAEQNARLAEMQASDTEKAGEAEAGKVRRNARGIIGAQKASLAAQGLDIGSGTALDLQKETAVFGEQDASRIKENAFKQAYGYRMEAMGIRNQGEFDYMSAKNEAKNTMLTGGMQAISTGLQGYGTYQTNKSKKTKEP